MVKYFGQVNPVVLINRDEVALGYQLDIWYQQGDEYPNVDIVPNDFYSDESVAETVLERALTLLNEED